MIDVRLQSLKPPAIQYASVQPQSTLRMTSRMGCCVPGQGFYPRSCYFKSELLFISEAEGSSTCVGDIGSPLMMPEGGGRFFSQVPPSHRICLIRLIANFGFFMNISMSLHSALLLKCENPLRQDFLAGVLAAVVRRRLLCSPGPNLARPSSNKSHIFFSRFSISYDIAHCAQHIC